MNMTSEYQQIPIALNFKNTAPEVNIILVSLSDYVYLSWLQNQQDQNNPAGILLQI
jgi:hypothetical protein